MSIEESVNTGEVRARRGSGILRASAIGSCVVVAAYDTRATVGGMAHVMLPGASPDGGGGMAMAHEPEFIYLDGMLVAHRSGDLHYKERA